MSMKEIKLYNIIFPVWLLLFFPPVIFITLAGNFAIDSAVLIVCFFLFKLFQSGKNLKQFYKKSILKVWGFGFLADIVGAAILFLIGILGDHFGLSNELMTAINYDPFLKPLAIFIIVFAMLVSGILIFIFNYNFVFKNQIHDKKLRFKIAMTIAVITIPWTFLLPTKWFY